MESVAERTMVDTHKGCLLITEDEHDEIDTLFRQIKMICDDEYIYKSDNSKVSAIRAFLEDY